MCPRLAAPDHERRVEPPRASQFVSRVTTRADSTVHAYSQRDTARVAGTVITIIVGSALVGAGAAINLQLAFLVVVAIGCLAALAAPPSVWVAAAVVAALTFKGLVSLGLLPSVATFLDLPLSWGALFVALSTSHETGVVLRRHLRWMGLLTVAVLLAWFFNPSEVLRPVVYVMLLGEPFAVAGALIACPPTPRMRAALEKLLAWVGGRPDPVRLFRVDQARACGSRSGHAVWRRGGCACHVRGSRRGHHLDPPRWRPSSWSIANTAADRACADSVLRRCEAGNCRAADHRLGLELASRQPDSGGCARGPCAASRSFCSSPSSEAGAAAQRDISQLAPPSGWRPFFCSTGSLNRLTPGSLSCARKRKKDHRYTGLLVRIQI